MINDKFNMDFMLELFKQDMLSEKGKDALIEKLIDNIDDINRKNMPF